ncbi:MAG: glycosyltransferase family 39 protein [Gemmatimonadales bacterium]
MLLFTVVALLRLPLLTGQGLWADEFFSLAIATGHSLEHPADDANPMLGDFVQGRAAMPAGAWGRYLTQENPPAGVGRISRAVFMSDTSPPLYYVLLGYWTRGLGTSDAALRLFSVLWALTSVPLLWLIARRLGGTHAAVLAVLLYAFAPTSLYYSGEGRMYSLLCFLALGFAWLTLRLHDRGVGPTRVALWTLSGTAGFLTHYFFVFVWAGCLLWLLLHPGRASRAWVVGAVGATILLALPWYVRVPESLGRWRVTGDWLEGRITARDALTNPLKLVWSLLSGRGLWGGSKSANRVAQALFLFVALAAVYRPRRGLFRPEARLALLWLGAACIGPVLFDVVRGSSTSSVSRYALGALPAAVLVAALALSRFGPRASAVLSALILLSWTPGIWMVLTKASRYREAYLDAARAAGRWAGPSDLVIIHSIPSGVLGVARYLRPDVPVAAWVGQLGQRRVPDDVRELVAGRRRVVLVRIHDVGAPAPEQDWLRTHARLVGEGGENSLVLCFEPASGPTFGSGSLSLH